MNRALRRVFRRAFFLWSVVLLLPLFWSSSGRPIEELLLRPQAAYDSGLNDINAGYILTSIIAQSYDSGLISGPFWEDGAYGAAYGDWVLEVRGQKFYWASGRLLNSEARAEPDYLEKYAAYPFYYYPEDLPPLPRRFRAKRRTNRGDSLWQGLRPLGLRGAQNRNREFFRTLLDVRERSDMDDKHMRELRFLGRPVEVHQILRPVLERIDAKLATERRTDRSLDRFLGSLRNISGYVWRNIAGTDTLSLHSYGIAVDLIPWRWNGETYWRWTEEKGLDWRDYPYEKRWQPPPKVVRAFEEEGFIWGGKWYLFDTMHFEYRPEFRNFRAYFRSFSE